MDNRTSNLYKHVDTQKAVGQPGQGSTVDHNANARQSLEAAKHMAAAAEAPKEDPRQMNLAFPIAN